MLGGGHQGLLDLLLLGSKLGQLRVGVLVRRFQVGLDGGRLPGELAANPIEVLPFLRQVVDGRLLARLGLVDLRLLHLLEHGDLVLELLHRLLLVGQGDVFLTQLVVQVGQHLAVVAAGGLDAAGIGFHVLVGLGGDCFQLVAGLEAEDPQELGLVGLHGRVVLVGVDRFFAVPRTLDRELFRLLVEHEGRHAQPDAQDHENDQRDLQPLSFLGHENHAPVR